MRIVLLPAVRTTLDVLIHSHFQGTGCLMGHRLGSYALISEILPLPLRGRNSPRARRAVREKYREKFLGVFFADQPISPADDLLENVIMEISSGKIRFSLYQIDSVSGEKIFHPLKQERGFT
jgi:hypothetical protein